MPVPEVLVKALIFVLCVLSVHTYGQQVHIAYSGGGGPSQSPPNGMTVSWHSKECVDDAHVMYGLHGSTPGIRSLPAYRVKYTPEKPADCHYHAELVSLLPGTHYDYIVSPGADITYSFTTKAHSDTVKLAIIGDMGTDSQSEATMGALSRVSPLVDFILHVGDIAYADDGFLSRPMIFTYERTWNRYMIRAQEFSSGTPYMTLPGNHEAECHSPACIFDLHRSNALRNFTAYNSRFRMPSQESGGKSSMWYSFTQGSAHFVNINTESDYKNCPSDQYTIGKGNGGFGNQLQWLEHDLEIASQLRVSGAISWIVVSGHRPIYSVSQVSGGKPILDSLAVQNAFEDLLARYKVDLYISGHVHGYERHYPLFSNRGVVQASDDFIDPSYPIHVVNGAAGSPEKHENHPPKVSFPKWNAYYNYKQYGYNMMEITPSKLTVEFKSSDDDTVLDHFTITKSSAPK